MLKCDFNKVIKTCNKNFLAIVIWIKIRLYLFINKVIEITLRHRCSPVNLLHIFKTAFTNNISAWLLQIGFDTLLQIFSDTERKLPSFSSILVIFSKSGCIGFYVIELVVWGLSTRAGDIGGPCPPFFFFFAFAQQKEKRETKGKKKTFKAETIKRLSPRSKCYCLAILERLEFKDFSVGHSWWPTVLVSVPWPLHFGNPFRRPCQRIQVCKEPVDTILP